MQYLYTNTNIPKGRTYFHKTKSVLKAIPLILYNSKCTKSDIYDLFINLEDLLDGLGFQIDQLSFNPGTYCGMEN